MHRVLIIIPTYNEVENIPPLVTLIAKHAPGAEILVVDDNSPDGTAEKVKTLSKTFPQLKLLHREKKAGLAAAYIHAFSWALSQNYDLIFQMDGDLSHPPSEIPKFLQALETADVAVSSRYVKGGSIVGWGMLRKLISRGGNFYARTMLGLPVRDLTGGYNGFRREVLEKIDIQTIESRGYAFLVELKYRAFRKRFMIKEIPICFTNRIHGSSKMSGGIIGEAAYRVWKLSKG